jgi:signal transduction histidine kinase
MIEFQRITRAAFPVALSAALSVLAINASPAEAEVGGDSLHGGGYFVYGLIVLCGALLVLMLRQSGRLRDAARELRDTTLRMGSRDLVLSTDRTAALYFEVDPGSITKRRLVRVTPGLRRFLGLPEVDDITLDVVLDAFDTETRNILRDRLEALCADGLAFTEDLVGGGGDRVFAVTGQRIAAETIPNAAYSLDIVWFQDAGERIESEFRLSSEITQRQLIETVVGALPMPVWRRGADLELAYRNPAAIALMASDDPSQIAGRRAVRTNHIQSESKHVVVAGDRRLFEFSEWPMPDGSGTVGWVNDVTMLEAIQSDLARLVAAHEEVLEELSTAIAIFGPDKRLSYFNAAFSQLWKVEADQLKDEPTVSEFLNLLRERRRLPEQSDFAAFRDQWNDMFTKLIGPRQELLFLPDETTLRMVVAAHPNGGLLLTFEDVTDTLVLERSYNTLSAVQRETIDILNEALAVFGSDGKLSLLNSRFSALWRLPEELAHGQPHISQVLDLMRPNLPEQDDWDSFRDEFISRLGSRSGDGGRVERPDGLVVDYALVPLSDGATLIQYWDVTDTTRMQLALQERTEALEQADRLKSEFLANVSYELRTPLNAIIGFSELLRMQTVGPMNLKQLDYAESVITSSNRLVTLINDILDLASIEAGYMELDLRDVDVPELMNDLVVLARERSRTKAISLAVDIAQDVSAVRADPVRLKQALFNLISNALKFTPVNGRIDLSAYRDGANIVVTVSDTGVGIPDHLQSRIFETFERGTAVGRSKGAGLGLALVERLVHLHGGVVTIESDVGVGTSISIRFPDRLQAGARTVAQEIDHQ